MAVTDNEVNWRKVFQDTAANLKITNTPDGTTEQPVKQATAASLKCTNTPDGTTPQPVIQKSGVSGIWPAADAVRICKTNVQSGAGTVIIYTVTAGKKLFISGLSLTSRLSADNSDKIVVFVRDDEDAAQYYAAYHIYDKAGQQTTFYHFVPALEAEAAWDVCLSCGHADMDARAIVTGWEEAA